QGADPGADLNLPEAPCGDFCRTVAGAKECRSILALRTKDGPGRCSGSRTVTKVLAASATSDQVAGVMVAGCDHPVHVIDAGNRDLKVKVCTRVTKADIDVGRLRLRRGLQRCFVAEHGVED